MRAAVIADQHCCIRIASERGGYLASELGVADGTIKNYRARMRRNGLALLPDYFWRDRDEQALTAYVRRNREWSADYWERAGLLIGGRSARRTRERYAEMRRRDRGLPEPPRHERYLKGRQANVWDARKKARLLELAEIYSYRKVGDLLGVTAGAVRMAVYRARKAMSSEPGAIKIKTYKYYDYSEDDAKYGEKMWRDYEKYLERNANGDLVSQSA